MRRRASNYLVFLVAPLTLLGCYESTLPLPSPGDVRLDAALVGTWRCVADRASPGESALLRIFRFDDVQYYVEWVEGTEITRLRAYAARVDDTVLMNLQEIREDERPGTWLFGRYRFDSPGRLRVTVVSDDAVKHLQEKEALDAIRSRVKDESLYEVWQICSKGQT